jgi:peptide/nickel transport system ATP-binding protein/glutathione transport system ATP-binding protein
MSDPLLAVEDLSVEFRSPRRTLQAVRGLSFTMAPGETVAIVGESGSGKSVTALSIMRLIESEGGTITGGRIHLQRGPGEVSDLIRLPAAELRQLRGNTISMIFQEPMTSLNPVLRIGEQLAEVLMLHQGTSRQAALVMARRMLDRVRIPEAESRLRQYPHELSGGMRQRVMIAMALLCRPRLLIADEPTTALDVTIQAQILSLIRELQQEIGMAVLFITHDLGIVAEIAERVIVMRNGERIEQNDVASLFARPRQAYTRALIDAVPRLGQERGPPPPAIEEAPVLAVKGLVKRFPIRKGVLKSLVGHVHAVENVSFELGRGETLALVGESGCGKSTTARVLMKLLEPTAGSIRVVGQDVTGLSPRAMRPVRREIQMIFQDPYASLNPRLSALELITEPLAIHEPSIKAGERRERAAALLRRVGLEDEHLDRFPHQFSGGQRQRLSIARALCLGPKIIVADEPVSALDVSVQAQVIELMRDLQAELGISYLFISHDMGVVERMSHRVAVMYLGQIVEIGPTAAVLHDPRHSYTRRLLAAVPVPDPSSRRAPTILDTTEVPSPIRPVGDPPATPALTAIGPGHLVQAEVAAPA